MHHIIADGWSAGIIAAELRELTARDGMDEGMPDLAIQYGDFAAWQREGLNAGKSNLSWNIGRRSWPAYPHRRCLSQSRLRKSWRLGLV